MVNRDIFFIVPKDEDYKPIGLTEALGYLREKLVRKIAYFKSGYLFQSSIEAYTAKYSDVESVIFNAIKKEIGVVSRYDVAIIPAYFSLGSMINAEGRDKKYFTPLDIASIPTSILYVEDNGMAYIALQRSALYNNLTKYKYELYTKNTSGHHYEVTHVYNNRYAMYGGLYHVEPK